MSHGTDVLTRKVESLGRLSPEIRTELSNLPLRIETLAPDQDAVRQWERPTDCCLVLDGFMFRYFILPNGTRQILAFHTPGEIPDMQSLHLSRMDHGLAALNQCQVAFISHASIRQAIHRQPELCGVFWRETLIDAAVFRQWIVNIGRRDTKQRLAHMICEFYIRLKIVGRVDKNTCKMPLSQVEIADAIGVSSVHVNRTLQSLRAEGIICFRDDILTIPDWERLQEIAEFDPSYLQIVDTHDA